METQSDKKWISLKESPLCDVLRASTIRMTVRFLWGPEGKLGFKNFDLQVSDSRVFQKYCWLCGVSFSNKLFDFWCLSRNIRRTAQILDRRDSLSIWAVSDYICHEVLNLLKRKYHFKPWHIIAKVMFCVHIRLPCVAFKMPWNKATCYSRLGFVQCYSGAHIATIQIDQSNPNIH